MTNQQIRIPRCPRCGVRGVSVEVKSSVAFKIGGLLPVSEQFCQCPICCQGVIRRVISDRDDYILPLTKDDIPEHLPDNVGGFFKQGVDNVEQGN